MPVFVFQSLHQLQKPQNYLAKLGVVVEKARSSQSETFDCLHRQFNFLSIRESESENEIL